MKLGFLISSFLFWIFTSGIYASQSNPTIEPQISVSTESNSATTPEEQLNISYEHFLEVNFFQDYLISFPKMNKIEWLNHISYFFILPENRESYFAERSLNPEIISQMEKLGSIDISCRKVNYLLRSQLRPPFPNLFIEDVVEDSSRVIYFVEYFLKVVQCAFSKTLADSPKRHAKLFDKREVFFRAAYHIWIAVFKLMQGEIALPLLDKMHELSRAGIKDHEEDLYDYKGNYMTLYFHWDHFSNLLATKLKINHNEFRLYPQYNWARFNPSIGRGMRRIQGAVINLLATCKGNNDRIENDFDDYYAFKAKIKEITLLSIDPQDSPEVVKTKKSVNFHVSSLLGPLQRLSLVFTPPKTIYHALQQLVHEHRFLERMMETPYYSFRLFFILRESHKFKIKSMKKLLSAMRLSNYEFSHVYKGFLKLIPKIDDKIIPQFCFSVDVYDPKDFVATISKLGISDSAIPELPILSPDKEVQVVFLTVSKLLLSLAYNIFSALVFQLTRADALPICKDMEGTPFLGNPEVENIFAKKFYPHKKLAIKAVATIPEGPEKIFILNYANMIELWIKSKCFYLLKESDPQVAIKKTAQIFPIPVYVLTPTDWFSLEFILWQKSNDTEWKSIQFNLLAHLESTLKYIETILN